MIPLTNQQNISYDEQEAYHIFEGKFCMDKHDENYKNKKRLKITVITQKSLEELHIAIAIQIIKFQIIFQ